jgi:hypothetical protein
MLGNDIFFWENLNTKQFACPCYLHTWDQGIYNWGNYQSEELVQTQDGAEAGGCNWFDNTVTANNGWFQILYNDFWGQWEILAGAEPTVVGLANDQRLALAPGLIVENGAIITVDITLRTENCNPHVFALYLSELETSGVNSGYPEVTSWASILTVNEFATSAMTSSTCTGLSAGQFGTNNDEVVVTGTYTNSTGATVVRWLVLQDTSPTSGITEPSNVIITNVQVSYSNYPAENITGIADPIFNPTITANSNSASPNGQIQIDNGITNMADANCWWCWSDRLVYQGTAPDRTGLSQGWYALKMVSLTLHRTYPIQLMYVPYFTAAGISSDDGDFNNWWREGIYAKQGDTLYKNIANGKNSGALDLLKTDIIQYLWDKSTALDACMTAGYIDNFENYLVEEMNTCTASGNLGFLGPTGGNWLPNPLDGGGDVDLEEELDDPGVAEGQGAYGMPSFSQGQNEKSLWGIESLVWNRGSEGFVNPNGDCCYGYIDYPYPSYVYHKKRIWEQTSENADSRTQPGSFLGRSHWKLLKAPKTRNPKSHGNLLRIKRKNNIFELESRNPSLGTYALKEYGGERSNYITLENTKILKPEMAKTKLIV